MRLLTRGVRFNKMLHKNRTFLKKSKKFYLKFILSFNYAAPDQHVTLFSVPFLISVKVSLTLYVLPELTLKLPVNVIAPDGLLFVVVLYVILDFVFIIYILK